MYEIDVVRSVTAICVVAVHAISDTIFLATTSQAWLLQNGVVNALHYTREIFVVITAFVLVYGHANRPFSARTFAKKRAIGVLLPYVAWTIFYDMVRGLRLSKVQWTLHVLGDLLNGTASFQLYYILLVLEFYLIFPWFLGWIQRAGRHPWRLLGVSFALQLVLVTVEYRYMIVPPFVNTTIGSYIFQNQDRYLPLYQFYVVLGGVAALYIKDVRAFLVRHGAWTIAAVLLTLAILLGNMLYLFQLPHPSVGTSTAALPYAARLAAQLYLDYITTVFQPAMQFYVAAVAAFLYWITYRWAIRRVPRPPSGYRFWQLLSNASFGVYLMQGYFLTLGVTDLAPHLPLQWWEPLRVALTVLVVVVICFVLSSIMLYIPGVSRLIGHPCLLKLRRKPKRKHSERDDGRRMTGRPAWADALVQAMTDLR
jgi:probable poly-beta-1,6-N-acetyl-D-glucosamine export protein